jgi:hypothetical protein
VTPALLGRYGLVVSLVAAGILLRSWNLGGPVLWMDEAESAVNALTILEHGVPTDRYLDLPIFENTLTRAWPESEEYEFKDLSYSDRGLAVYHGWVPLYAMAASFALLGVGPDTAADAPRVVHDPAAMRWRALAARAPSIVFSAIFLVALFFTGRALHSEDAGTIAVAIGAFTPFLIWSGRVARYHAAALALGTLCLLSVWLMCRRGRWRDFAAAGALFALLFHTHLAAFGAMLMAFLLALPAILRGPRGGVKAGAFLAVVAVGAAPWVVLTGFLDVAGRVPMAYPLLRFPQDLGLYAGRRPEVTALMLGALVELGAVLVLRHRLPARIAEPVLKGAAAIAWLSAVLCLSNVLFLFATPAASFWLGRLTLLLMPPAVLLAAVALAANAQALSPRRSGLLIAGVLLLGLSLSARAWLPRPESGDPLFELVEYLRGQQLSAGTRIYAPPSSHLALAFYTGLPVQSVAPVRREFFDASDADMLIVERAARDPGEAPRAERRSLADENPAIFRGYQATDLARSWPVYFYRFVDPERRSGARLNYLGRIRSARAVAVSSSWVVYHADVPLRKMAPDAVGKAGSS